MKHLTHAELIDAIESPAHLAAAPAHHLQHCAACRTEATALRDVLARAVNDPAPEPSPLFWDHFAVRVADALRDQSITPERASWFERLRRPFATWAVAAAAIMLVILSVVWRATLHAPSPVGPAPAAPSRVAESAPAPQGSDTSADNPDMDERWAVVRVAAEGLAWEDVHDAGISAEPGTVEGAALELTAEERYELARLLGQELKRNGV
jgi:hypothetical protein